MSASMDEIREKLHETTGRLNFHLEKFGDYIATREGFRNHTGMEAIQFYLIEKYHWLPRDVRSMSFEDIRFVLEEEMQGWTTLGHKPLRDR